MWVNGERKGEGGRFLTAVQHKWRALTVSAMRFGITPAPPTGAMRCDLERVAAPLSVALQQLGFFWPNWPATPPQASRRNKKPGAGVPPGHYPYFWIVRLLHEIRVTRVKVTIAEPGQVARPRVRPACDRRYAVASPLTIQRRKICRLNSAVRPQPSYSRSWPSSPPPTC